MSQRMEDARNAMKAAAIEYWEAFAIDLGSAKRNLSADDYERELLRIAWVNRSSVSETGPSVTNLTQKFEREIALDLLHRLTHCVEDHMTAVIIRGVEYHSVYQASKLLDISEKTIRNARDRGTLDGVGLRGVKPCVINGVGYTSQAMAAQALGLPPADVSAYLRVLRAVEKSTEKDNE